MTMGLLPRYKDCMVSLWIHPKTKTYYVRYKLNGRDRRESLKTKEEREAVRRLNNFKRDLQAGKIRPISDGVRIGFAEFMKEFLEYVASATRDSTYILYDVALRKAKAAWGDVPLSHITTRHIDMLIKDMRRDGLSVPTINKNLRHIKAALRKAHDWEYLKSYVRFPKKLQEEAELRYLTADQLRALIGRMSDPEWADFCLFGAYSGFRSSEILRLEWSDIDNPQGFIRKSKEQKNKSESRWPINASARAILERCKARNGDKPFRFTCRTWVSQKFKQDAVAIGCPTLRLHDLRHTYGSHMAMAGVDLKSIQLLMDHKSISSTLVYAKVSPEHLAQENEKLNYGPMPVCIVDKKKG